MSTLAWIVVGGLAMNSLALVGSVILVLPEQKLERLVMPLVAFAAGSLLGGALFYMLPDQCFYNSRNRFDDVGEEGLRDRSSRPHHSPRETYAEVVDKIIVYARTTTLGYRTESLCRTRSGRALSNTGASY
ncbi:MAG: leucine zipper domain-containing protein [Acidimicrobiia bacterium]|nr:leucine zipper domain-containing protein [Acidimicrobiia bacterium]